MYVCMYVCMYHMCCSTKGWFKTYHDFHDTAVRHDTTVLYIFRYTQQYLPMVTIGGYQGTE